MVSDHAKNLSIFWGHGKRDQLIRYKWGESSVTFLKEQIGVKDADPAKPEEGGIVFRGYDDLDHSVNEAEILDAQAWLKKIVPE